MPARNYLARCTRYGFLTKFLRNFLRLGMEDCRDCTFLGKSTNKLLDTFLLQIVIQGSSATPVWDINMKIGGLIKIVLLACALVLAGSPCFAQFTIRSKTSQIESQKDTIRVHKAQSTSLDLKLYNQAYDDYLRKLEFKKRNNIKLESSLTLNQNQFDNWAAGGSNTISLRAYIQAEHKYTRRVFGMTSSLSMALGFQNTDRVTRKNEDWFNISTTPSWRFANRWSVSASATLKTGLMNSYTAPGDTLLTSAFFAPAQLLPAAGISYKSKNGALDIYLAPVSGKIIFVSNDYLAKKGGFGITKGDKIGAEVGSFFRVVYDQKFFKTNKLSYSTRFETFIRYDNTPTLWWENNISYKITKLLAVKLYVLAIYDDSIATPRSKEGLHNYLQINQSFGLGLSFNLQSKKYNDPPENFQTKAREKKLKFKK